MRKNEFQTFEKEYCPFTELVHFLSKKWMIVVLKSISDGCKSFTDIEKNLVGVNPRILSNRLKDLQEKNFVVKKILTKGAHRAVYCLTLQGKSLSGHIDSISAWAKENYEKTKKNS
ncbi:hypothetical protein BLD25_02655 [Candidatus Gracilibacteria bacterium GN02-872]|nr:hypothetical protein BLD25_02655 [Candidatus Gracilibacteria bacterium GN02-872]RKW23804.1 MAG: transcriptional regulator [Candidatus Gracilibacteria bacterium]